MNLAVRTFLQIVVLCSTPLIFQSQLKRQTLLARPKNVLADFRNDQRKSSERFPAATEKHVLSTVFRKYLTDDSQCKRDFESGNETDPLKAARDAGQIVPSIVDSSRGSFTAPGQRQIAYVISVTECNASHADNFGTKRVAIFSGEQLIADMDIDFKSSIVRTTDLDGDGVNELLMTSGDMHQGTLTEMASLFEFKNGTLRIIEDFGIVLEDSCGSESPGSRSRASVISTEPFASGKMPNLTMKNYESKCRPPVRWRLISNGKMPE